MLKRIMLSAVLLMGASTSKLSADMFDDLKFYVGVVGGVNSLDGEHRAEIVTPALSTEAKSTFGATSGIIGGVAGVGMEFCDDYFFVIQGNAVYNSLDRVIDKVETLTGSTGVFTEAEVRVKNNFQWGFDARFGMKICGAMPYILGGFESGEFKRTYETETTVAGVETELKFEHKKRLYGGKAGLGVAFPISCGWIANLEYSYTWFGDIKEDFTNPSTGFSGEFKTRLDQGQFLVGINYLF